ncbi:hypothetical protein LTR96_000820 [Exophiala xenobiotica]|nr:hypothetical protein LTR96_000820 [Exophiala xenobiotica]KAK5343548.1 hypothetical protein LTR98_001177 [Exophiala xenobiotica]
MKSFPLLVVAALVAGLASAFVESRADMEVRNLCIDCQAAAGDSWINWTSECSELAGENAPGLSCANFDVPLDYTEPESMTTLTLTLVKIDAVQQPVKGSILFNPGGPGDSGVQAVISQGQTLMTLTGGHYNIVGFDPRGVNQTLPFSCYSSDSQRKPLSPFSPLANSSDAATGQRFAASEISAMHCLNNTQELGGLLGTAFVVRDMVRIIDALGEDGLLRYYGVSWGTLLGATFAAMFPERVDKVVLDGNINVHEYYAGWEIESSINMDDTYAAVFSGCIAASNDCALASSFASAEEMQVAVDQFLAMLKYNPVPYSSQQGFQMATYDQVKTAIVLALYNPSHWPWLAQGFAEMMTGNFTGFFDAVSSFYNGPDTGDDDLEGGITCGDQAFRAEALFQLEPLLTALGESSKFGGLDFGTDNGFACSRWKVKAKEVYSGNFQVKTKNPVLLVGNTYDPVTPLASAWNTSAGFDGSVVLQHHGYGHTSAAQPSLCTVDAIRAYFDSGILPAPGTICEPDVPLYGYENLTEASGSNGTARSIFRRREEDLAILAALSDLADAILP